MKIIVIDDEPLALKSILLTIEQALPNSEVLGFTDADEALEASAEFMAEIAFLDVQLAGISGLELAKRLIDQNSSINIIFVTGYSEYAMDAHRLYVSGFLLKPVSVSMLKEAIDHLRYPPKQSTAHIRVQTFGNFDVFVDSELLVFHRSKAKELLAYLIDRRGTSVTAAEIASVLWEDKPYIRSVQMQTQKIISFMMKTLRDAGVADMIIKKRNSIAIDTSKIDCDYYNFLNWNVHSYVGEYMRCYSWAEMTTAALSGRTQGYANGIHDILK